MYFVLNNYTTAQKCPKRCCGGEAAMQEAVSITYSLNNRTNIHKLINRINRSISDKQE